MKPPNCQTDPVIRSNGWESLIETEYKDRYMLGMKISEDNLPKLALTLASGRSQITSSNREIKKGSKVKIL